MRLFLERSSFSFIFSIWLFKLTHKIFCLCRAVNRGSHVSEATAMPTAPLFLPRYLKLNGPENSDESGQQSQHKRCDNRLESPERYSSCLFVKIDPCLLRLQPLCAATAAATATTTARTALAVTTEIRHHSFLNFLKAELLCVLMPLPLTLRCNALQCFVSSFFLYNPF